MTMNILTDTAYIPQQKTCLSKQYGAYGKVNFGNNKADYDESSNDKSTNDGISKAIILGITQKIISVVTNLCGNKLLRGKEFTSKENVDKVVQTMKKNNKLSTEVHFLDETNVETLKKRFPYLEKNLDIVAEGKNAFFTENGNIAVAPKSKPSLILHELGHATNHNNKKLMYGLQKLRIAGMIAPTALMAVNSILGENQDGKENFIERHAGKIGFLSYLPTIIEEGVASIRGIKAAKKCFGNSVNLKPLKQNYFFAWMTYVLAGVATGIASRLAISEKKS